MSETPFPIQNSPMENPTSGTSDCDVPTPHRYASPLVDSSPPGSYPTHYPSFNALLLTSDKTTETDEPGVRQGGDQTYSHQPFDILPTHAHWQLGLPAFRNSYPHDATYSDERFACVEESSLGYAEQYHPNFLFAANAFGNPEARPGSRPALAAATAPVYAPQDDMLRPLSAQGPRSPSALPQDTPLSPLESNARPPLRTAASTAYLGGTSDYQGDPNTGHHHYSSPPLQPVASSGHGRNVKFDTPVHHSIPDPVVQGMGHMCLDLEASISPHPEIASQQPPVISPPTGYAQPCYASPEATEANGQDHPSSVLASAYGGNDYSTQYHPPENGTQSWGEQMSTRAHGEAVSAHSYLSTLPPYSNTGHQSGGATGTPPHYGTFGTMMFDQIPDPGFSLQMYFPAYHTQVAPATMHASGEGYITGSFASSDERYNYPLQRPAIWNGAMRPSTATITTRAHRGTSSLQYHYRAPHSSTRNPYPSDVAVNALLHNMPPVQHGNPRQRNAGFIPYREPGAALQGTPSTLGESHFVASPSALSDDDRTDCSPPPATCPPTTEPNAQNLLRRVLGPTPRLKNEALVKLVLLILRASFYRMHEMEPTGDSEDGRALLRQLESTPGYTPAGFDVSSNSIFTLFVSHSKFRCLICWSPKQSMVRGVGCVRSHLNHRPFPCLGEDGCKSCPKGQIVKRFFTASLLHDHCSKQERAIKCTYCGRTFTSNIKRHWESKHKHAPFPYEDYPTYQNEIE